MVQIQQIKLSNNKQALINKQDYNKVKDFSWHQDSKGYVGASIRSGKKVKKIFLHKLILQPKKGFIIDHKNRNKLDNTRDNLRHCTHTQNQWNSVWNRLKGIRKIGNKWRAEVWKDGANKHLGYFDSEEKASLAYNKAIEYRGKFAKYN